MVFPADYERYERARRLLDSGKPWHLREAYELYEQLAREGDPNCQVFVGWMSYEGRGTNKDEKLGLEWFRKAAAVGSPAGAFYCGRHAAKLRNYAEALRFFHQAAEKQYGPGLLWLGLAHVRGYGVPVNDEKGIGYLKRAAEAGNFFARRELALMMIRGKLGIANIVLGFLLLLCSAIAAVFHALSSKGHSEKLMG
ncbi:MAG TPA: tetratricopeptide repeat protein [Burkholderiales bacterium]|nr:tetratricopeptide repeat protein [Burkholderiales bacterium]